jgi:non-ribosomal peptide synthetase component F
VFGDERVTFAELEALSNQLADALIDAGCSPGDRVCLLAPKAPVTIAAMLGTLKAGCAYVPLDPASPSPRSARIVEATEPAAVFLAPEAEPLAAELRGVGALGDSVATVTAADAGGRSDRPHPRRAAPGDPAHILFTSGSTGRPKGVVVTHASVSRFVEWAVAYFGIAPGERLSALPPLHFDLSTFDLYGAIRAGAELHLPPVSPILPGQLARYIAHIRGRCSRICMARPRRRSPLPITPSPRCHLTRMSLCRSASRAMVRRCWCSTTRSSRF